VRTRESLLGGAARCLALTLARRLVFGAVVCVILGAFALSPVLGWGLLGTLGVLLVLPLAVGVVLGFAWMPPDVRLRALGVVGVATVAAALIVVWH
jgi:hypothetical protein